MDRRSCFSFFEFNKSKWMKLRSSARWMAKSTRGALCGIRCIFAGVDLEAEDTLVLDHLGVDTVENDLALALELEVLLPLEGSETQLVGEDDLLPAGELVLGAAEGLDDVGLGVVLGTDREEDLTDLDASDATSGLTEGTTHTSLKSVWWGVHGEIR